MKEERRDARENERREGCKREGKEGGMRERRKGGRDVGEDERRWTKIIAFQVFKVKQSTLALG